MINPEHFPEFDHHYLVKFIEDKSVGLRGFIAIHRDGGASLGATRLWRYASKQEALRDALRLSRLMTYKSAIAGFRYGGAKAALMIPKGGIKNHKRYFEAYASQVNVLQGKFITGTDVGVIDDDIKVMERITPYVIGSKLDPAHYTAIGVVEGIKVSLKHIFGRDTIRGRSFAIQGVGKVGSVVLRQIYKSAKNIYIADVDGAAVRRIKKQYPRVTVVAPAVIHKQEVDVFVPCALSGVLNRRSVPQLRCKIVAGSANNQLTNGKRSRSIVGKLLRDRDILYAPDYIINTGGFIAVVDEYTHGKPSKRRIFKRIENMEQVLGAVFRRAKKEQRDPGALADHLVEALMKRKVSRRTL